MRADETLADRTHFGLDAERWKAFMEALDAPPVKSPASAACSRSRASSSAAIVDGRSTADSHVDMMLAALRDTISSPF